jgi:Tfp pilus assembly protein PilX
MNTRIPTSCKSQQGAVLFVALVFLVLITLLGLTASSTSILQERMTGGLRNGQLGLMGAETAARGAEAWLWNLSNNNGKINCGYNGGDNGFCYAPQTADDGSGNTIYANNPLVVAFRTKTHVDSQRQQRRHQLHEWIQCCVEFRIAGHRDARADSAIHAGRSRDGDSLRACRLPAAAEPSMAT